MDELLEALTQTPAVPGREHRLRDVIRERVEPLVDEVSTDALGSLIATRHPRPRQGQAGGNPTTITLAAHMDQIGFLARYVDDKGFIRISPVGGFDPRTLFSRRVTVCPDVRDPDQDLPGVLNPAGKPIHLATAEERKKVPELEEFAVDLGLPADQVKERVHLGDMIVLQGPLERVGRTSVAGALDNRVACWMLIRMLEGIEHHHAGLHAVFTVQEEVGLRGAQTAAYGLDSDLAIAVDTTLCIDTPGVGEEQQVTRQGEGAALTVMDSASIADLDLLEAFERVARAHDIPHQRSVLPRGGTDAGAMQRAGRGRPTFTLSCPTRYIHSVTEMVHDDDLAACRDLLTRWVEQAE